MTKRLYRSRRHKVISGVCGGIAQYVGTDSVLIRLAFVALAFSDSGLGLLIYFAAMFIVPLEPVGLYHDTNEPLEPQVENYPVEKEQSSRTLGIILIVLGAGLIVHRFGLPHLVLMNRYWPFFNVSLWPLALVLLGAFILLRPGNHN